MRSHHPLLTTTSASFLRMLRDDLAIYPGETLYLYRYAAFRWPTLIRVGRVYDMGMSLYEPIVRTKGQL